MKIKILILLAVSFFLFPKNIYAQEPLNWSSRCIETVIVNGQSINVAKIQGIECIFQNLIRLFLPLLAMILFLMFIAGSFQYLTSSGDSKKIDKAKGTITSAVVALLLFFGIWILFQLIKSITGVDLTIFKIPGP